MPLSRQLVIIILILFIVLFIGTLSVSIKNTRTYLTRQLQSHAQDTASSLGLSLTPYIANDDLAIMTSMVDAIFDRGYYREIKITTMQGAPIIKRTLDVRVEGVPSWFVNTVTLETPQGQSIITQQWQQVARVHVVSHPGYAYLELWRNTVGTFWWFLFSFIIGITAFIIALHYILMPLKKVEKQAVAIARREFPIMYKLPWTTELRRVVMAMNKMSLKVKGMLQEQTNTIERVRREADTDKLTGLANRRSFDMQLEHMVKAVDEINQGAVLLIRLGDLEAINNSQGYLQGDEYLRQVADIIKRGSSAITRAFVARIAGGEFAILLPGIDMDAVQELAKELAKQIQFVEVSSEQGIVCHIGGGWFSGQTQSAALLAKADMALRASAKQKPNGWQIYGMDDAVASVVHGAQHWNKVLQTGMHQHNYIFLRQPIVSLTNDRQCYYEVFTHLLADEGKQIPAMTFIPIAERLGMMPKLDRYILENLIQHIKQTGIKETERYFVNLSPSSIHDREFMAWLYSSLAAEAEVAQQLIIETSEHAAVSDSDAIKEIVTHLHQLGCRVSLDHFGTAFAPFGYLHDLKLDHLKVHGDLVRGVTHNRDNQFFIQSLCQIAHSLEIQLIGEFVEKEDDWTKLKQLGLDGGQGYYLGQPEIWLIH